MMRNKAVTLFGCLFVFAAHAQVTWSSQPAYVSTPGPVGIGTTGTPTTKLQVKGGAFQQINTDNASGIFLDAVASDQPKVGWRVSDNSERFRVHFQGVNTSTERLGFIKTLGGTTEVLSVLADGRVGVDVSNPAAKFHVRNGAIMSSDANYFDINVRLDGNSIPKLAFTRWTGLPGLMHNAEVAQFYNAPLSEYSLGIGTGTSTTSDQNFNNNILTMTMARRVGIQNTTPAALLDVGVSASQALSTVLGRLAEGNSAGGGTYLAVRAHNTQPINAKGFSLEHSFWGEVNSSITFHRGGGTTGGFISLSTNHNIEQMRIDGNGNVGIGTTNPDAKLAVNGTIHTKEVKVDMNNWSDYVFDKDYKLRSLSEVQQYIDENHHLPEVPSEKEVLANGQNLGEINAILLKKIEELTLYVIEQEKRIKELEKMK